MHEVDEGVFHGRKPLFSSELIHSCLFLGDKHEENTAGICLFISTRSLRPGWFSRAVGLLESLRENSSAVLVGCKTESNWSAALLAAHLINRYGLSTEEAAAWLLRVCPSLWLSRPALRALEVYSLGKENANRR